MPSVNGSKNVLTAAAGYQVGDWAEVEAQGRLDIQAMAEFSRGFDVQLGAEALVSLDGAIREYLAADVTGEAHAAARVRAQVQVPLDLFDEAGLAVRLQATAEASASVTLAVGLQVGSFLQLAGADERMRGVPLELLKAFLAEFAIQGGVMAKASAAAMAYANLAMTGRLIAKGSEKPGFTVAAEAGVGLKAGAGFRVLARFGVDDPRRWIRRSIDIAVDESIAALRPALSNPAVPILDQLKVPAKIALRTAFEVGSALAENNGAFAAGDGSKLSLRCVQVALEEVQRHVFEEAVAFSLNAIQAELRSLGNAHQQRWQAAQPQRQALATLLGAMPEYRLEATQENVDYWLSVIDAAAQLVAALLSSPAVPPELARPLAMLWSAVQLASITLNRISNAQARVSLLGQPTAAAATAFDGTLPNAPAFVRTTINSALGRSASSPIAQRQALDFLIAAIVAELDALGPRVADPVRLIVGSRTDSVSEALSIVLSNIGAFVPDAAGTVRAEASAAVIRDALLAFFDERVDAELRPALLELAGESRHAALFADEVLLGSLETVVHVLFARVLDWHSGSDLSQKTLRELCSSLMMGLCGRSLVVCGDVLLTTSLQAVQSELRAVADRVDEPGGVAKTLSDLTGLDRPFVAEVIEEALRVCADAFEPMSDTRRARLRHLLYEVIDSSALSPDQLARGDFVPNQPSAQELALLLGEEIAGNVVRFIQAFLARVGALILDGLLDLIEDLQRAVDEWITGLVDLIADLSQQLVRLAADIARLGAEVDRAADELLARLSSLLNRLSDHQGSRSALREVARDLVVDEALGVLRALGVYKDLPRGVKALARSELRKAVGAVLDTGVFDIVLEALASVGDEAADFLEDIRAIEPGDDIEQAVLELFLDRLEDAVDDVFGGDDPHIDLAIDVPGVHISLGRITIPLSSLITDIRRKARSLQGIKDRVGRVAEQLLVVFEKEAALAAAEAEERIARDEESRAQTHLAQSRLGPPTVEIVRPAPGAALRGEVELEIVIRQATAALLDGAPPGQQRVFLWINQHLLPLDAADVTEFGGPLSLPAQAPGLQRPVAGAPSRIFTHAVAHDIRGGASAGGVRGRRSRPGGRSAPEPVLARTRGAARAQTAKIGGRALPPAPLTSAPLGLGRNVRPMDIRNDVSSGPPGIRLSVPIPLDRLGEGINTVTVVVIPGVAEQRAERSLSFLWQPAVAADAPFVMPGRLVIDGSKLPAFARDSITRRFGGGGRKRAGAAVSLARLPADAGPQARPRARDRKNRMHQAWFPTRALRQQGAAAARAALMERMRRPIQEIEQLRHAVRTNELRARPTPLPPPTEKRKGENDGYA